MAGLRIVIAQQVDDGLFRLARIDAHGAVIDVGMAAGVAHRLDAQGVALVFSGQRDDALRHGRGEQQRAAAFGRGVEDEFEILAEAHVEHLVGLVERRHGETRQVERAALQMVAQASRRADDDLRAGLQRAAFGAGIHAADAGDDARAGLRIEPAQLLRDLQGEFAGRGDDERLRGADVRHGFAGADQIRRHGEAEGHRLAGAGLGRDENVAALGLGLHHRRLDGGGRAIIMLRERAGQRRAGVFKGQCLADRLEVLAWLIARGVGKRLMESAPAAPCLNPGATDAAGALLPAPGG